MKYFVIHYLIMYLFDALAISFKAYNFAYRVYFRTYSSFLVLRRTYF